MLNIRTLKDGYLDLDARGRLTREDYDALRERVEEVFAKHSKVRALLRLTNFEGLSMQAFIEELKFDAEHRTDFSKIAVLGDRALHQLLAAAAKPVFKGEVRYFRADGEEEAALAWLDAPIDPVQEAGLESFPASDPPAYDPRG